MAVYGGRFGEFVLAGARGRPPRHPRWSRPGARRPTEAEVLVTLVDDAPRAWPVRSADGSGGSTSSGPASTGSRFDVLGDRLLTCSRGAGGAGHRRVRPGHHARLREAAARVVDHEPPARVEHRPTLGGLDGRTLGRRRARGHRVRGGPAGPGLRRWRWSASGGGPARRRSTGSPSAPTSRPCSGRSDHLVVAAPATPATHHLLDEAAFAAVKPGVHLVNVARGSLVDQDALLRALDDGRVALASLDVVDPEPLPDGHPLRTGTRRCGCRPHVSWSSPRPPSGPFDAVHRQPRPIPGRRDRCSVPSTWRPATDGTR